MTDFIFFGFGCWNNQSRGTNFCLNKVIDTVKSNINKYKFGLILGDNLYPHKPLDKETVLFDGLKLLTKSPKYYCEQELLEGLRLLNQLEKPLYLIHGNHDFKKISDCSNKDAVIENPEKIYQITEKNVNDTFTNILIKKDQIYDNFVFIFLSYDEDDDGSSAAQIAHLKAAMDNQDYKNTNKNFVIVSHYPLVSYKYKKGNSFVSLKNSVEFTKIIFNRMNEKKCNVYYICADTHNYQYITITENNSLNKIHQYIVGTGGAEFDEIKPPAEKNLKVQFPMQRYSNNNAIENGIFKYNIDVNDIHNAYGYCEFTAINNEIKCKYMHVVDVESYDLCFKDFAKTDQISVQTGTDATGTKTEITTIPSVKIGGNNDYYKYQKYKQKYKKLKTYYLRNSY